MLHHNTALGSRLGGYYNQ